MPSPCIRLSSRLWMVVFLAGCGGGIQFAEVEGKLLVDGSPVDKIQVEFFPLKEGPRSIGFTDSEGKFTLATIDGKNKGAVVGKCKVALTDVGIVSDKVRGREAENVDLTEGRTPRVAERYRDAVKTPLEKEVTAGKCVVNLDVTAK